MSDIVAPEMRSRMMSRIRGRDTSPERAVRRYLHACGFRFRLHVRNLPGSPDIVLPRHRTVVFVHGCFWHRHEGCRFAYRPKSRVQFWEAKLGANVARDRQQQDALRTAGWAVQVIWECDIEHSVKNLAERLRRDSVSGARGLS